MQVRAIGVDRTKDVIEQRAVMDLFQRHENDASLSDRPHVCPFPHTALFKSFIGISAPHAGHDSAEESDSIALPSRCASEAKSGGAPGNVDREMIFLTKGASSAVRSGTQRV
jgi:hypothetical protein